MKGFHFGGRQTAIPIGIGQLECRHAASPHALMLCLEFRPTQMTVVVRIQGLEALLMKTLGCFSMIGLVVMILMAVTFVMCPMPVRALDALRGCSGRRARSG